MKRPDDWNELYLKAYRKEHSSEGYGSPERAMFEAGADAYEKVLKEKSPLMTPEQMELIAPDRKYGYGWLVFIEKEVE